jgi:Carboxypeptidase regulatory-like domain
MIAMRRNTLIGSVAALVIMGWSANAQQVPVIAGTVSASGQTVAGATVVLIDKNTSQRFTFRTDDDGRYIAGGITAGTVFDIEVTASGFLLTSVRGIEADPSGMAPIDVGLTRAGGRGGGAKPPGGGGDVDSSPPAPDGGTPRSPRLTGREFLVLQSKEEPGYGLYSYLLFGSPPNDAEVERYESAIRVFLQVLVDVKEHSGPRERLNVTYLPVKQAVKSGDSVTWIVKDYNYARGQELLLNLTGRELSSGPYLVSTRRPLSEPGAGQLVRCENTASALCQDLSTFPAALIPAAFQLFTVKASQNTMWTEKTLPEFVLYLRKYIEIAALGLPAVKTSVEDWKSFLAPLIGAKQLPASDKTPQ